MEEESWGRRFANEHGGRLIFMAITLAIGVGLKFGLDMDGEANTLLIAVGTLALNQARGAIIAKTGGSDGK